MPLAVTQEDFLVFFIDLKIFRNFERTIYRVGASPRVSIPMQKRIGILYPNQISWKMNRKNERKRHLKMGGVTVKLPTTIEYTTANSILGKQ